MDFLLKGGRTIGRGSQGSTNVMTLIDNIAPTTDPINSAIISPIVIFHMEQPSTQAYT
jgi:hypothetical protein